MFHTPWHFIVTISIIHVTTTGFSPQRVFPSSSTTSISSNEVTSSEVDVLSSATKVVSRVDANGKSNVSSKAKSTGSNNFQRNWGNVTSYRKNNNFVDGSGIGNSSKNSRREVPTSSSSSEQQLPPQRIPFIIENIGRGEKNEIEEIVRLCIDVFFNEQEVELQELFDASSSDAMPKMGNKVQQKSIPPWKAIQLAYLRNFQTGEILARNAFNKEQFVNLIVARRVYYAAPPSGKKNNIRGKKEKNRIVTLMDGDSYQIFNADLLPSSSIANGGVPSATGCVMAGEIIGYCEVSEKSFGLGGNYESTKQRRRSATSENNELRPYLSNLSVVDYARKSGVGSKLLDAGETAVRSWNAGHTEIVLQVEEDNTNAIQFYKRRGWEFVFADPTCRRYDTSGFFLRECRITKYAMIKRLDEIKSITATDDSDGSDSEKSFIEKFMNSFFSR